MLQTVLGLDAARIASAFLSAPATLSQRLVRAKARIRDAGIGFVLPGPEDLPARVTDVLDAIYAAYGSGWDDVSGADPRRRDLTEEAIWLGRLTATLLPDEPEALGLLALMLHCEARRAARRDTTGAYVPFDAQDTGLWSRHMIAEAERSLARAGAMGRPARYQLEAAIQSAHAQRRMIGSPGWEVTAMLYDALVRIAPSAGSLVGRAAALAEAEGPESGLAALDPLADDLALYQAYWALRAHLLRRLDHGPEAEAAASRAVALSEDPAVRAWLLAQSGSA